MAFDRSQFKASKMTDLEDQQQAVAAVTGSKKKGGRLDLEMGSNKVRIYPAHPGDVSFMVPIVRHFLPIERKDVDKDGNESMKIKRFPVFSALVHGPKDEKGKPVLRCIIDEYIKLAHKVAYEQFQDQSDRDKFLFNIKNFKSGTTITSNTKWGVYGDLTKPDKSFAFGEIELPTSVRDKLNELAITEDDDEPIDTDPFTDPDLGKAVIILRSKKEAVNNDLSKIYQTSLEWKKDYKLTDEQLEVFMEQTPLSERYMNVYKAKDFNLALEGLKRFDEEHGLNLFSNDDFLDICEDVAKHFEGEEEEEEAAVDEHLASMGASTDINLMEMPELKAYIKNNNLQIRVLSKYTVDDVREIIHDELSIGSEEVADEVPGAEPGNLGKTTTETATEPTNELPWEKAEKKTSSTEGGGNSRLEALKAKMAKGKAE